MKKTFLIFMLTGSLGCLQKNKNSKSQYVTPLPSFNLLLNDSITYFNTKNISEGKSVVFLYFRPDCPYSQAQVEEIINGMPYLKDLQFYIFTASSFTEMKNFYLHYQLQKYPNIITGVDYKHYFANYFKTRKVPYMAIYGKDRILKQTFVGKTYSKQIKEVANK